MSNEHQNKEKDFYQLLGVANTAPPAEIHKAYIRLARESHPDRFTDPEKREQADAVFQRINSAFNTLRDEKLRTEYDRNLQKATRTPEEEARLYFKNAELREQSGDWANALKLYYEAMRIQPDKLEHKMGAARVLARDKSQQRKSAGLLQQIIDQFPDTREAYMVLGDLYTRSRLHTRAKRVYEIALGKFSGDSEIRSLLTQINATIQKSRG